ncbi:MAG: SDR family oxidoreductase [Woeseiaceae bacterium]|nr:SDR family oxidoreductase [Woeseiaceae bacterium]
MKRFLVIVLLAVAAGPGADIALASEAGDTSPVVLITGANRGLGLELARQYGEAGWHVIGTARKPDAAADLKETGARIVQLDVTDADSVASMATELDGQPIDLLINNAGVLDRNGAFPEVDIDTVEWILDVNVLGPMRVTQALLPNLSAGDRKTIVGISSGLGSLAQNESGGLYGYRESKVALNMFTRSLANELRDDGFIVVAMNPGWVQTDMGGENAALTPEQSISGVRSVIDSLTTEDTGTFRIHNGGTNPW